MDHMRAVQPSPIAARSRARDRAKAEPVTRKASPLPAAVPQLTAPGTSPPRGGSDTWTEEFLRAVPRSPQQLQHDSAHHFDLLQQSTSTGFSASKVKAGAGRHRVDPGFLAAGPSLNLDNWEEAPPPGEASALFAYYGGFGGVDFHTDIQRTMREARSVPGGRTRRRKSAPAAKGDR